MELRTSASRFLALFALAASSAHAQADTGELLVTVASAENRPLAGSTITVESRAGERRQAVADAAGRAVLRDLPAGLYRVAGELQGFSPAVEPTIRVVRGKTVPVDLVLPRNRGTDDHIGQLIARGSRPAASTSAPAATSGSAPAASPSPSPERTFGNWTSIRSGRPRGRGSAEKPFPTDRAFPVSPRARMFYLRAVYRRR